MRMERKTWSAVQLKAVATDLTLAGRQRRLDFASEYRKASSPRMSWRPGRRSSGSWPHEVMNSLTPVTSLAATAQGLVTQAAADLPKDDSRKALLNDAAEALETVTRRSEGLLHFVQNHRRLTKRMVAKSERLKLERVFARLKRLLAADLDTRGVTLFTSIRNLRHWNWTRIPRESFWIRRSSI